MRERCHITGTQTNGLPSSSCALSSSSLYPYPKRLASRNTLGRQHLYGGQVGNILCLNVYLILLCNYTPLSFCKCVGNTGCYISLCGSDCQILLDGEPHCHNNPRAQPRVSICVWNGCMFVLLFGYLHYVTVVVCLLVLICIV